jgi:photoactive yellow protein
MPRDRGWRLADIALDRLDDLPFGAIVVDAIGTIRSYNRYEANLTGFEPERVIGKNFFREVAPCTAVRAFEGRFAKFLASRDEVSESFDYFFPLPQASVEVEITFLKLPERGAILIAIERAERER